MSEQLTYHHSTTCQMTEFNICEPIRASTLVVYTPTGGTNKCNFVRYRHVVTNPTSPIQL